MIQLLVTKLDDPKLETVRRNQNEAIGELQKLPFANSRIIANVILADGVETPIAHQLGRLPLFVFPSIPRGALSAGRIDEIRNGTVDRSKLLKLKASGYGAIITVDLVVL